MATPLVKRRIRVPSPPWASELMRAVPQVRVGVGRRDEADHRVRRDAVAARQARAVRPARPRGPGCPGATSSARVRWTPAVVRAASGAVGADALRQGLGDEVVAVEVHRAQDHRQRRRGGAWPARARRAGVDAGRGAAPTCADPDALQRGPQALRRGQRWGSRRTRPGRCPRSPGWWTGPTAARCRPSSTRASRGRGACGRRGSRRRRSARAPGGCPWPCRPVPSAVSGVARPRRYAVPYERVASTGSPEPRR